MDKLIRLINEYGITSNCGPFEDYRIEPATEWNSSYIVLMRDDNGEGDWKDWHLPIPRLISKEYGFIKWLVENDKIDRKKLEIRPFSDGLVYSDSDCTVYRTDTTYEMLLMLLSISDTPIDLLCSLLK